MSAAALPLEDRLQRAREVLGRTQDESGSWKGDYGGPLFLIPVYVSGLYATGRRPPEDVAQGFIRYLRNHQRPDGGWGLDVESHSHVFTSVLGYVTLRLLGLPATDPGLVRAKAWFAERGGPLASGSWGKFILALLGLYAYEGLDPIPPELWLLPRGLPIHPARLWCHCRMVYLPMSWLYGQRYRAAEDERLAAIRRELYDGAYAEVDWSAARARVADTDAYTPRSWFYRLAQPPLRLLERWVPRPLRQRALAEALLQIRGEDQATHFICIGPINKVLNLVVAHAVNPEGPELQSHLTRLPDYLYRAADGIKVNGYNSSELWDTAFAVQAMLSGGAPAESRPILERAANFLERNQVLEDSPDRERHYRHRSKGGWPFSTRDHGWPISDCTAEGLKASLLLESAGLSLIPRERLAEAVETLLSLQNRDGGWATYELQRGPRWLELLNPSDVFSTIMVDVSYVECTSACVQALAAWRQANPGQTDPRIDRAITRGVGFIRRAQRPDGSWEGSWGVCFTYGTWFGVKGLVAAGIAATDPAIQRAAAFLRAHQRPDGAWSETAESCRRRAWVEGTQGHSVNTAWAVLTLIDAGEGESAAVVRAVRWLSERQGEDGAWPPEPIAGVFNRTCAIHYDAYLKVFPLWALAAYQKAMRSGSSVPRAA